MGTAIYYKHQIRADEGAFAIPAHMAEKPRLLEMDHERARANWRLVRTGSSKVLPVGEQTASGEFSQRSVINLFKPST